MLRAEDDERGHSGRRPSRRDPPCSTLCRLAVHCGHRAGWIITPDAAQPALPAIAKAFLAGSGADLIFASMDQSIGSLTSPVLR